MKRPYLILPFLVATLSQAQEPESGDDFGPPPGGFGPPPGEFGPPPGGFGPGGPMGQSRELIPQFDINGDGKLDSEERASAREWTKENPTGRGPGGRGFGRGGRRGRGGPPGGGGEGEQAAPGPELGVEDVASFPEADLYDTSILRTLFFTFPQVDWETELSDFYRTDVDVPATLVVDGETYSNVGMGFRGNSSYFSVSPGSKRSFNVSLDFEDDDQRLYGYKTLNLLNGHSDPSFLREALFSHIVNHYIPMPKVNFVRVAVNGESWGVYINVQQFNKDFLKDAFDTKDGVRWKVPAGGRSGGGGLRYVGDEIDDYRSSYQLKTDVDDEEAAYQRLIELCRVLEETPDEELIAKLEPLLDIEDTLWFLALDSVLLDGDGYLSRGSDFFLYEAPDGQFHPIFHDSNETFRPAGGGGPGFGGPRDSDVDGFSVSPLDDIENEGKPLTRRLLALPELRARYLAYVRTITEEWLAWDKIEPVALAFRETIGDAVADDTKKLYPTEAYETSLEEEYGSGRRATPSLREFVDRRREALINNPDVMHPHPVIEAVTASWDSGSEQPSSTESVTINVSMQDSSSAGEVRLHWKAHSDVTYTVVPFTQSEGEAAYVAQIPAQSPGTSISYYVEARSEDGLASSFYPSHSGRSALNFRVAIEASGVSPVVINEVMSSNEATLADPHGDYDDWIELYNRSDVVVDLAGYTLSDKADRLNKWSLPQKTTIAPKGYLLVWADEDGKAKEGLHANFKISKGGESIYLSDAEGEVMDHVEVQSLEADHVFARTSDGAEEWEITTPTPASTNDPE